MQLASISHTYCRAIDWFAGIGLALDDAQRHGDPLPTWANRHLEGARRQLVSTLTAKALPPEGAALVAKMVREIDAETEVLSDPNVRWRKSNG